MASIDLLNSTGVTDVDSIVRGSIGLLERSFPGRIRGYYLVGSYAVGCPVWTSDIDMSVVFKGRLAPEEKGRFADVIDEYKLSSPYGLDITPDGEERLFRVGTSKFQTASLLMYGEDIRAVVPLKPMDSYILDEMHFPYHLFKRVRGNPTVLTFPLDYPDPEGEFYGYDRRWMRAPDGSSHDVTKELVLSTVCAATALIALKAGQYVRHKSECAQQYRRWINDEWTAVVEAIYEQCRNQWAYLVPSAPTDRQHLRCLCERGLAFENHFLALYKEYLLAELRHTEEFRQLYAVKRLGQIIYRDQAVVAALHEVGKNGNAESQQAVAQTLRWRA